MVVVPANCSDKLQPIDLAINIPLKGAIKKQFKIWYMLKICKVELKQILILDKYLLRILVHG